MKATQKEFTSIVGLLIMAGHKGFRLKLEHGVGNVFRAKKDYVWFPGLQIVVMVDNNRCTQLRQSDGLWFYRLGRKNQWYDILGRQGGSEFMKLIDPIYVRYLNDLMMGDPDVKPEGRGAQSGDGSQAT